MKKKAGPNMKPRGFDGTKRDAARIADLRVPKAGTWANTPTAAACDRSLGQVTPLHVLTLLCKYRNAETGECFPSISRLARDLGLTDRRSIQRHIDKLVEHGYVVVLPRRTKDGRTNTSNAYVVLYPPLALPEDGYGEDESTPPSSPQQKAPGEPLIDKNGVVTHGATGVVAHETTGVPKIEVTPPWHFMPTPVALHADPRGAKCHTNSPTITLPSMNSPSAEAARAGARASAAASHDADGEVGKGTADTEPDQPAQHEARQEVPLPKVRDMRPSSPPRDPVGDAVRWIAKAGGFEVAQVWVAAMEWHTTLMSAGLSDQEAQLTIAAEANLLKAFNEHEDLVRKMGKRAQEIFDGGPSALPIKPSESTQPRSERHV